MSSIWGPGAVSVPVVTFSDYIINKLPTNSAPLGTDYAPIDRLGVTSKVAISDILNLINWAAPPTIGNTAPATIYNGVNVFPSAVTSGIKTYTAPGTPDFTWKAITAAFHTRTTGASTPAFGQYGTSSIYAYFFSNSVAQQLFVEFHVPHDYVMGTQLYINVHWSQTTVDTGGAPFGTFVRFCFDTLYAKGHQQEAFSSTVSTTSVTQAVSSAARTHMITEAALGTTDGYFGLRQIEPDGVILVRVYRDPADPSDSLSQVPYMHFCGLHYQSTGIGTKNKAPSFWA